MSLKIMVQYQDQPVIYDVVMQEDNVYHLRLNGTEANYHEKYIPEKIVIRKKGMIWISDNENYNELINALTAEIKHYSKDERA